MGCEYGSVYQINKRKLERVAPGAHAALFENFTNGGEEDCDDEENKEGEVLLGDNSGYMDSNTAQKLKDQDIMKLKVSTW